MLSLQESFIASNAAEGSPYLCLHSRGHINTAPSFTHSYNAFFQLFKKQKTNPKQTCCLFFAWTCSCLSHYLTCFFYREIILHCLFDSTRLFSIGCPCSTFCTSWIHSSSAQLRPRKRSLPSHLVHCFEVDPSEDIPEERQSPRSRWEIAWLPVSDHIQQK